MIHAKGRGRTGGGGGGVGWLHGTRERRGDEAAGSRSRRWAGPARNGPRASSGRADGTRLFATDWAETGDDGSPTTGDILVAGGELRLKDNRVELTRELDLSGFATATMTFDYREVGYDNNNDEVNVEIRSGGAGGWTRIVRYRGANVNTGSASFVLPAANLAVNTEVRFRTGRRTGNNDQFFVDDFIISVTVAGGLLDHFDI